MFHKTYNNRMNVCTKMTATNLNRAYIDTYYVHTFISLPINSYQLVKYQHTSILLQSTNSLPNICPKL